jgi:hypothetical protein
VEKNKVKIEFSIEELQCLVTLAEIQSFRQKFIDSKMPGYRPRPEVLLNTASAVSKLSLALKKTKGFAHDAVQVAKAGAA